MTGETFPCTLHITRRDEDSGTPIPEGERHAEGRAPVQKAFPGEVSPTAWLPAPGLLGGPVECREHPVVEFDTRILGRPAP